MDHKILLDLFDKIIVPIALYGVEVWGSNFIHGKNDDNYFDRTKLAKHETENIHYRFLKILLGVHRRTSSWAVASEYGRYPLIIKAFKSMCKFYNHIMVSESPIVKAAFEESKLLSDAGINSWYNVIKRICKYGNISQDDMETCDFENIFKNMFLSNWVKEKDLSAIEGKLGVFAKCKIGFNFAQYLQGKAYPTYKSALAKFRTSSHSLPIERE